MRSTLGAGRSYQVCVHKGFGWWAHFEFTRINIEPIILCKKIEDWRVVRTLRCGHKS